MRSISNGRYGYKLVPQLNDEVVLIGHSLGGIFLTKYLSENKFPKKIMGTFLVAAPYDAADSSYSLGDFVLPKSLDMLVKQGGQITLYQSSDDHIVDVSDFERYVKAMPSARAVLFKDKGHFMIMEFPEIVKDIEDVFGT